MKDSNLLAIFKYLRLTHVTFTSHSKVLRTLQGLARWPTLMTTKKPSHGSGGFQGWRIRTKGGPDIYGWQTGKNNYWWESEAVSDIFLVNISKVIGAALKKKKSTPSILEEPTQVFATEEQCGWPIKDVSSLKPDHINIIYGEVGWKSNFKETTH